MSQQAGVQLYGQSMNSLLELSNVQTIECYELDAEIINVDNLQVNNLLTTPNISNTTIGTITQIGTNIITQSGTGTNTLKNTNITGNLSVSGTVTYDVVDIDCENLIVQNDASLNNVNIIGNIIQTGVGTNTLKNTTIGTITQSGTNIITQSGTGNNTLKNTTIGTITQTDTNIITQSGTGNNTLKNITQSGTNIISQSGTGNNLLKSITQSGGDYISQSGTGNNVLKNITQSGTNIISQSGTGNNILKDTEITGDFQIDEVLQTSTTTDIIYNITTHPSALTALGSIGTFITFSVQKRYNVNFTINFNVAISKKETGTLSGTALYTENGIDGYGVTFFLYKNGVLQTSKTNTTSNGGGVTYYQTTITTGAYSYEAYCANVLSFFTINHTSVSTDTYYTIGFRVPVTIQNRNPDYINPNSVYGLIANTTVAGFQSYAGDVTTEFIMTGYTTSYATKTINSSSYNNNSTGMILGNKLVLNDINTTDVTSTDIYSTNLTSTNINSTDITSTRITSNLVTSTRIINNYISITTSPYTLTANNSYYLISRTSGTTYNQINLPNLTNNYTGLTVYLRKAPPTTNSNNIRINCLTGTSYYFSNMIPRTSSTSPTYIEYSTSTAWILMYNGDGDWYLLNDD